LFDEAERTMGIGQQEMNEILIETFDQVEEIADILAVELTKERDLLEIMEKANRALSQISDKIAASLENPSQRLPSFESLNRADEIISHTLQAVAHEIRNPLMAVGGFARRLALTFDPSTDGGKYLQMILKETSRLEETLSSMVRERPNLA
jgi:signal transduction histidine kinase